MNVVQRFITTNFKRGRGSNFITGIVIHTEGVTSKISGSADRSLYEWFNNPSARVSAHYYVTFSGKIEQYVRDEDTAWHAIGDGNQNVQTIGIEHQDNGYWSTGEKYTEAQYEASAQLIASLCKKYNIPCRNSVAGIRTHGQIDPKPCPGALDWNKIIRRANEILTSQIPVDNTYKIYKTRNLIYTFHTADLVLDAFINNSSTSDFSDMKVTYKNIDITSQFLAMANQLQNKIDELNKKIIEANKQIEKSKTENEKLQIVNKNLSVYVEGLRKEVVDQRKQIAELQKQINT